MYALSRTAMQVLLRFPEELKDPQLIEGTRYKTEEVMWPP
jgi:hypothetical protein